ncbi:hypothetical protein M231_03918 [Tremella mesenterica]|uniref:Epoxide hydrolase N-terminal domain-containing protein n=1 Tax=Tremella mesenterica TaxID=5217 RepID=A0A4Q1BM73_TREME|nr:uncharacterized protein TREMEDRAFT_45464 [Tremella mesenterica DSM 1558]EIW66985.1 hypothetical protein TREMEDRAFT_45464 [Tremella mesenterica DSM 1558]RXK38742.1 hypothetical protein M231_03918 [Tremella mesenterica]
MDFLDFSTPSSQAKLRLEPFKVSIPQEDIDDLISLVRAGRIAKKTYENTQTEENFGITRDWLMHARDQWLEFDWRKQEQRINSIPQFTTLLVGRDGHEYRIHFMALFSSKKDSIPILFSHGWPGCFLEFLPMCEMLIKRYSPGDLPYNIIIPSLPGYTFSDAPHLESDFGVPDIAYLFNGLMRGLGYDRYVAQGGDIGSAISSELGREYDSCVAVHLNYKNPYLPPKGTIERERIMIRGGPHFDDAATFMQPFGYALEQGTRPSTIGLVLSTSPLALLAWIGEKNLEWGDKWPGLETTLTFVSLYWFTNTYPSSIYPYRWTQGIHRPPAEKDEAWISKPTGYSKFGGEMCDTPKEWVAQISNLVWSREHDGGGHFAALERPEELFQDVDDFVKAAWGMSPKLRRPD